MISIDSGRLIFILFLLVQYGLHVNRHGVPTLYSVLSTSFSHRISHIAFFGEKHKVLIRRLISFDKKLGVYLIHRVFFLLVFASFSCPSLLFLPSLHTLEAQIEAKKGSFSWFEIGDFLRSLLSEIVLHYFVEHFLREFSFKTPISRYRLICNIFLFR